MVPVLQGRDPPTAVSASPSDRRFLEFVACTVGKRGGRRLPCGCSRRRCASSRLPNTSLPTVRLPSLADGYPLRCRSSSPQPTSCGSWFGAVGVNRRGQNSPEGEKPTVARSPRGQGHRPLTAKTRVRIPVGSYRVRENSDVFRVATNLRCFR